jgi:tRNA threonylcarbamoyl adenosine modification protein YeaZ
VNTFENPTVTLAIESAIGGGSLAMFHGSEIIGERTGDRGVSRAEDLLINIDDLINQTKLDKKRIHKIAVSIGPGSFTGLRIGIATAMGLKRSLGIEYIGVSLFQEMVRVFDCRGRVFIAVPMGKAEICIQEFQNTESDPVPMEPAKTISKAEFDKLISTVPAARFVLHSDLIEIEPNIILATGSTIIDAGRNLAAIIGIAAQRLPSSSVLAPFYVQNPRFA